jgi:hypothetical protein
MRIKVNEGKGGRRISEQINEWKLKKVAYKLCFHIALESM